MRYLTETHSRTILMMIRYGDITRTQAENLFREKYPELPHIHKKLRHILKEEGIILLTKILN